MINSSTLDAKAPLPNTNPKATSKALNLAY
jgi:hypothetical protein